MIFLTGQLKKKKKKIIIWKLTVLQWGELVLERETFSMKMIYAGPEDSLRLAAQNGCYLVCLVAAQMLQFEGKESALLSWSYAWLKFVRYVSSIMPISI